MRGEFARSLGESLVKRVGRVASRLQEESPGPVDVLESDDEFLVVVDAPGATADDVQVRYDEGTVLVRIDRFREHHGEFEMRYPGRGLSLDTRAELPEGAAVDPDNARAVLREDGTLHVFLPKLAVDADGEGSVVVEETEDATVTAEEFGVGEDDTEGDERDRAEAGDEDGGAGTGDGRDDARTGP